MVTQVDRPFLDRSATVVGIDHNWRPSARLNIQSRLIGSNIDQAGTATTGSGFTTIVEYEMEHGWRQQWLGMHFGDSLQINDFGYLSRANLNYGHWQVSHRITDFPKESKYPRATGAGASAATYNDHGLDLQRQFRMSVSSQRRDGGNEFAQDQCNAPGHDDRVLRGHGIVQAAVLGQPVRRALTARARATGSCTATSTPSSAASATTATGGWSANFNPTITSPMPSTSTPASPPSTRRTGWCGSTTTWSRPSTSTRPSSTPA
jgi:hypothetical protein